MADSEAKKKWIRENTIMAAVKLNKNTDADIIEFYNGKVTAQELKTALREYIKNHMEEK